MLGLRILGEVQEDAKAWQTKIFVILTYFFVVGHLFVGVVQLNISVLKTFPEDTGLLILLEQMHACVA